MMDDRNNPFPHDGEGGRSCTGYGCDCDEKNYGYVPRKNGNIPWGTVSAVCFILAIVAFIVRNL